MTAFDADDSLRDLSKATLTCQHQITEIGCRPYSFTMAVVVIRIVYMGSHRKRRCNSFD
jgi:hypothetical protein